jgi:hypothetical protein
MVQDLHSIGYASSVSDVNTMTAYKASSWLWAAKDGNVMYHVIGVHSRLYHIEILSYSTTIAKNDKFGMVSDGLLTLRGQIKQAAHVTTRRKI